MLLYVWLDRVIPLYLGTERVLLLLLKFLFLAIASELTDLLAEMLLLELLDVADELLPTLERPEFERILAEEPVLAPRFDRPLKELLATRLLL
ncbi:hypothetical protein MTsPCn9_30280 [Croceitalea sp. MTPC9]|nr:hypothetical protein MTsPCn6_21370 [Croceitalea sp. MTPC6]GMN18088.1 hypothetical protein MTsPCn9_30280 [Croceitalea sp. MTPC9]